MTDMASIERWTAGWRRLIALAFAFAVFATPIVAFAQGAGNGGTGSGGTGSGSAPGGPPAQTTDGGGRGLAWVVVLLAIAVAIWLFTRWRSGHAHR